MIESTLTKTARITAVRDGIMVSLCGKLGARTDGKTIGIMNFSDEKFERIAAKLTRKGVSLLKVVNGFLDHEAAHCYYTFTEMDANQLTTFIRNRVDVALAGLPGFETLPLGWRRKVGFTVLKTLANFGEDRRIEYRWVVERFSGSEEFFIELSRFDVGLGDEKPVDEEENEVEAEAKGVMGFYKQVVQGLFDLAHRPAQAEIYATSLSYTRPTSKVVAFVKASGISYERFTSFATVQDLISSLEVPTVELLRDIFSKAKAVKEGTPEPKPQPKPKAKSKSKAKPEPSEDETEEGQDETGEPGDETEEGQDETGEGSEAGDEGDEDEDQDEKGGGSKAAQDDEEGDEGDDEAEGGVEGDEEGDEEGEGSEGSEDEDQDGEGSENGEIESNDRPTQAPEKVKHESEEEGEARYCEPHPQANEILDQVLEDAEELAEDRTIAGLEELQDEAHDMDRAIKMDESADPLKVWEPASTQNDTVTPVRDTPTPSVLAEFTREVAAISVGHIGRKLLGEYRNRFTPGSEGTRINLRQVGGLAAGVPNFNQLFIKKENKQSKKGTAVSLVLDLSGSMSGSKMHNALVSAGVIGDLLQRLGIKCEIIGFTTKGYWTGMSENGTYPSHGWSRTEALDFYLFKSFNENMATATPALASWVGNAGRNNCDGESVQFCANRLLARNEARKIMVVLSDGLPAFDGADPSKAQAHLRAVCKKLENTPGFELYGIGIESVAVKTFYAKYVILHTSTELPSVLGKLFSGDATGFTTHSERKASGY